MGNSNWNEKSKTLAPIGNVFCLSYSRRDAFLLTFSKSLSWSLKGNKKEITTKNALIIWQWKNKKPCIPLWSCRYTALLNPAESAIEKIILFIWPHNHINHNSPVSRHALRCCHKNHTSVQDITGINRLTNTTWIRCTVYCYIFLQ